jgi:hypothetical protein
MWPHVRRFTNIYEQEQTLMITNLAGELDHHQPAASKFTNWVDPEAPGSRSPIPPIMLATKKDPHRTQNSPVRLLTLNVGMESVS